MRKWIWVAVAAVVVVGGGVAAFASPGDDGESKPVVITSKVERRDLRDEVTVQGTLGRVEERTVNAAGSGGGGASAASAATVNKVYVTDGAELGVDQPIIGVDGRDAITENGDIHFFRGLDVGAKGADVLQLEQILQSYGYSPGRVDTLYTEQTRFALAQWQAVHGYPGANPTSDQTITVSLQPGTGYTVGEQSSGGVTVGPSANTVRKASFDTARPIDAVPAALRTKASRGAFVLTLGCTVKISALPPTVNEGGSAVVTVTGTPTAAGDCDNVQVFLTASGTATPGLDYGTPPPVVTLPPTPGTTPTTASFTVNTLPDLVGEPDENVLIGIAPSPASYTVGSPSTATITITGNSQQPVVTLTAGTTRVKEGVPLQFTLGLDRPLAAPLQVFLTFVGDAVEGLHYSKPGGAIIVAPGMTSLPVNVPTLDNDVVEPDRYLTVGLAPSATYTTGVPHGAQTVIESEDLPKIDIVGGNKSLGKGGAAGFQIVADQRPLKDTTVQYQVSGTAKPGIDVKAMTGVVLLRAGQTRANVPVVTLDTDVVFLPTDMIVAQWPTRVGQTFVEEGDVLTAGMPLFSITETGFTVTLKASAGDRTKLKIGQQVTVTLSGGDATSPGVITELDESPTIDKETQAQTYEGKVQVQGDFSAADGAPVTIDVVLEERLGVITVPIAAVKQNGEGKDVVRTIDLDDGGKLTDVIVETGLSEGSFIEIKSGLQGDEIIVVEVDQGSGG